MRIMVERSLLTNAFLPVGIVIVAAAIRAYFFVGLGFNDDSVYTHLAYRLFRGENIHRLPDPD